MATDRATTRRQHGAGDRVIKTLGHLGSGSFWAGEHTGVLGGMPGEGTEAQVPHPSHPLPQYLTLGIPSIRLFLVVSFVINH